MSFADLVNMAKGIKLPPGTVNYAEPRGAGRFVINDKTSNPLPVRKPLGTDYSKEVQAKDMQKEFFNQELPKDDASFCTETTYQDIVGDENACCVYSNYNFKRAKPNQLPVNDYKEQILDEINSSLVTIIKGHTGCGKSTQIPQFVLDYFQESNLYSNIVVTQPRRIAATSIAKRICEEREWELGTLVGYQIGLEKKAGPETRILFCTAGVLLQQLVKKRELANYTHIIVDEVHERDSETDFLLIILRELLKIPNNRTKLILMSATIEENRFANYFSHNSLTGLQVTPPVIEMKKKDIHKTIIYHTDELVSHIPIDDFPDFTSEEPKLHGSLVQLAAFLVTMFQKLDKEDFRKTKVGSVLIFLPGLYEIEIVYNKLQELSRKVEEQWLICPLHSSVTYSEQMKIFVTPPEGSRKIILATNIAESSITVPDVKYVIDFCLMKIQIQEPDTCYSSLKLEWISKAQAQQRAGRVGRVMAGRVYRLIPREFYNKLPDYAEPEMLRCKLDNLILKAKMLDMGPPRQIIAKALDPPDLSNIQRSVLNLKQVLALLPKLNGKYIVDDGEITNIGRVMSVLPLDPQLSKLIILGYVFDCLEECIIMACALSVKSLFSAPFQKMVEAYNSKLSWSRWTQSDPITYYLVYTTWRSKRVTGQFSSYTSETEWARKFQLELKNLFEVSRLEDEITTRLDGVGIKVSKQSDTCYMLLKIVLAGACFPNFFVKRSVDEQDAVRALSRRDPNTTVYLKKFPLDQPGHIYIHNIKEYFQSCGSDVIVGFEENSEKVYVTFQNSYASDSFGQTAADGNENEGGMPGKILSAVYRAIKLRHADIKIVIPLLPPQEARKMHEQIFGPKKSVVFREKDTKIKIISRLPPLRISIVNVVVTHINTPSHFYVQFEGPEELRIHKELRMELTLPTSRTSIDKDTIVPGKLCVTWYMEESTIYCRAKIVWVNRKEKLAKVFFIDYGNVEERCFTDLYDFAGPKAGLLEQELPLAIRCYLAGIQPSNKNIKGKGDEQWVSNIETIFRNFIPNGAGVVSVYSAVNDVMAVYLYKVSNDVNSLNPVNSLNYLLYKEGLAEICDEPYLSREDNNCRRQAQQTGEDGVNFLNDDINLAKKVTTKPSSASHFTKVTLQGPFSPLEMILFGLKRKADGKIPRIEPNSVNSVLLDPNPLDSSLRFVIATAVTTNKTGNNLTLRGTTQMPRIKGLLGLVSMIFAPKVELRHNNDRTYYSGALCGLGYDEKNYSYCPEDDMEVKFEVKYTNDDLNNINRIRYWMNILLGGDDNTSDRFNFSKNFEAHEKVKEYMEKLLKERRCLLPNDDPGENNYEWNIVPEEYKLEPHNASNESYQENSLFPLIWAISLNNHTDVGKLNAMTKHLNQLQLYSTGDLHLKGEIECKVCQLTIGSTSQLTMHLKTTQHNQNAEIYVGQSSFF